MKSAAPFRLLIRSRDGAWSDTACRDLREVRRVWSARYDAAGDAGILCSGLSNLAPRVFDSVAKRHQGRMLLSSSIRSRLPPSFSVSAEPVATVEGTRLHVGLRGWVDAAEDRVPGGRASGAADDSGEAEEERQDWLGAFLRENPDAADHLRASGIEDDASYLGGEAQLRPELRRRLGIFRARRLAGPDPSDPCALAGAAPPWLRERRTGTLALSRRTVRVFKAEGVGTVGDLAGRSSAELLKAPNFGPLSLADALRGLIAALEDGPTAEDGSSWVREDWLAAFLRENPDAAESLSLNGIDDEDSYLAGESGLRPELRRRLGVFRAGHAAGSRAADPCVLAKAAPPWLRGRRTSTLNLSTRTANVFKAEGVGTVGDLAGWSYAELLEAPNFGRRSLADVLQALTAALDEGPIGSGTTVEPGGFLGRFRRSLANLPERERDVLTRRLGFGRERETLQRIGDDYGVTHERIRQLESRAIRLALRSTDWLRGIAERMASMLKDRERPLTIPDVEREDPWFEGVSSHRKFFCNLVAARVKGTVHLLRIDGAQYFAAMGQEEWERLVSSTARELRSLTENRWSEERVRGFVGGRLPPEAKEFAEPLWRTLSPLCRFSVLPDGERVLTGYGSTARQLVGSVLAGADAPMRFADIVRTVRGMESGKKGGGHDDRSLLQAIIDVGLRFGQGVYGLRRHLDLSDRQAADVRSAAESVILSQQAKQWHCSELLFELRRRSAGGLENLDKYALDIVLAGSKRLAPLGRLTWTASGGAQDRMAIRRETAAVLEEAGRPLSAEEIRERLQSRRGLNETFIIAPDASLVPLGKGLWGLNDRDVPVKRARQLELIEILVGRLEAKQSGILVGELHEFLALDGCPPGTFAAIAAQDGRLKKRGRRRCLYLAKWGEPRRGDV